MRKESVAILLVRLVYVYSTSCKDNPSQVQCLAYNNRFILPRYSNCNPFRRPCRMGDLVDNKVASCKLKYSGNEQHSLTRYYKIGSLYRCIPEIRSSDDIDKRVVSVDIGEPRCTGVKKSGTKAFTCGEKGTRCVCDAPRGARHLSQAKCRCQYFIDFCAVSEVCTDPDALCTTMNTEVTCKCPPSSKTCTLGINQCSTDPSLCRDLNADCIELYDQLSTWTIGGSRTDDGYACVNVEDIKLLKRLAYYCDVSSETLTADKKVINHIDACCFKQLVCGSHYNEIHGNILSYRPCYCNAAFRKCLIRYHRIAVYEDLAGAAIRTLNQLKSCKIDEGQMCNPRRPETCEKGDFIDPKIAHCRINCKTGPLLPIGKRMCSIRQCKPPNHVEGVRIIDVPDRRTSSICEAVRSRPYLCGKGDTRCVCDGRPSGLTFTDRCRCQFWPLEI